MTPKQKRFCEEYLIDLSATKAAIRAGYSARTAKIAGSRLMTNDDIQTRIAELMASRSEALGIDAQGVVERLWKIADFDIRRLFRPDGSLIPVIELDNDTALAIAAIDATELASEEGTTAVLKKFRASDRLKALEMIGRHLGMFTDRVETIGTTAQVNFYIPDNGRDPELTAKLKREVKAAK